MRVFISWSGDLSREVAQVFDKWLPQVIQQIDPFFSPNIPKGKEWNVELRRQLAETDAGLFCITRENVNQRWLNFEAGAVANALRDTAETPRVLPFLFGMTSAELPLPLSAFQYTTYEKEDVRQLVNSINGARGNPLVKEAIVASQFDRLWPELEAALDPLLEKVPEETVEEAPITPVTDQQVLQELLDLARTQHRAIMESHRSSVDVDRVDVSQEDFSQLVRKWTSFVKRVVTETETNGPIMPAELYDGVARNILWHNRVIKRAGFDRYLVDDAAFAVIANHGNLVHKGRSHWID